MQNKITHSKLKEVVEYDPVSGLFARLTRFSSNALIGPISIKPDSNGYIRVMLYGVRYKAHRLAWFYMTGEWPKNIDHKDGIRNNNKFSNLRSVTHKINCQNQRKPRTNNSAGALGVHYRRGKFVADIGVDGRTVHLGAFSNVEDASLSYILAKRKFHEGCLL